MAKFTIWIFFFYAAQVMSVRVSRMEELCCCLDTTLRVGEVAVIAGALTDGYNTRPPIPPAAAQQTAIPPAPVVGVPVVQAVPVVAAPGNQRITRASFTETSGASGSQPSSSHNGAGRVAAHTPNKHKRD